MDETNETDLKAERLTANRGNETVLRVIKRYKPGRSPRVYLDTLCNLDPNDSHPITLKQSDLKKRVADLNLTDKIEVGDRTRNAPYRQVLWEHYSDLPLKNIEVEINDIEHKAIWEKKKNILPHFALFKVDRSSSGQDSEVRDPISVAAKIAVAENKEEIERIVSNVASKADEIINRTLDSLREIAPDLAVELSPEISGQPKWDSFKTSLRSDNAVPFNKKGSGTKRLVLLSFFKAEAERKSTGIGRSVIYGFEEPESSQHPKNQEMLLDSFKKLARIDNAQVILTTHSPSIAQSLPVESLKLVSSENGGPPIVEEFVQSNETNDVILKIAESLGVESSLQSVVKVVVMVEGPSDIEFLYNINRAVREISSDQIELKTDPRVAILAAGGSNLKYWVDKKMLSQFNCVEYHIYDRDTDEHNTSYSGLVKKINEARDCNSARLTQKREIENYVDPNVVSNVLRIDVKYDDEDDAPQIVSEASKRCLSHPISKSRAKKLMTEQCTRAMGRQHLKRVDPESEVLKWFEEISALARSEE